MSTLDTIRTILVSCSFALLSIAATACDDDDDGGDTQGQKSGDSETGGECGGSVYGDQSECSEYISCVETNCQTQYETCFGADYLNGNFGGVCADYMTCNLACDCGDTDCTTQCYNTHAAMGTPCGGCLISDIGACVGTNCLDSAQSCG